VFAVGIAIFTFGSLACGLATSSLFLVISRACQGVGGAIMFATSLALLAQSFQGKDRGVAFGAFGAITGVAIAVGPVLGGALTSGASWRWIFYVNIPIGVLALLVTLLRVEESRDPNASRPDWVGFATFSVGLAALVFGLIRSSADGWDSATVVGSLATAAVLLAAFLIAERIQSEPMLDLRLLRVPTFNGGLAAAWAISASIFSALTFLILYMQNILGLSAVATGVRFLPLTGAIFLTAGIAGRLTTRVPRKMLIGSGFLLVGGAMLLMRGLTPASGWTHLLPGMIVAGIGAGLVNVPLVSTAVGSSSPPAPAWRRASTPPSARSASQPASPPSARCSQARSAPVWSVVSPRRPFRRTRTRSRMTSRPAAPATRSPPHPRLCADWSPAQRAPGSSVASTRFC
jgi:EmrB/QacA subfamily drug resistance transporter